jgi:hypothetical protein
VARSIEISGTSVQIICDGTVVLVGGGLMPLLAGAGCRQLGGTAYDVRLGEHGQDAVRRRLGDAHAYFLSS